MFIEFLCLRAIQPGFVRASTSAYHCSLVQEVVQPGEPLYLWLHLPPRDKESLTEYLVPRTMDPNLTVYYSSNTKQRFSAEQLKGFNHRSDDIGMGEMVCGVTPNSSGASGPELTLPYPKKPLPDGNYQVHIDFDMPCRTDNKTPWTEAANIHVKATLPFTVAANPNRTLAEVAYLAAQGKYPKYLSWAGAPEFIIQIAPSQTMKAWARVFTTAESENAPGVIQESSALMMLQGSTLYVDFLRAKVKEYKTSLPNMALDLEKTIQTKGSFVEWNLWHDLDKRKVSGP